MFYWGYVQGFTLYRIIQEFFCPVRKYTQIKNVKYPWLWVGAINGDNVINVTETVNNNVYPGCVVNNVFLEIATGIQASKWKYLDTTLNEVEFPEEGITIPE